MTDSVSYPCPCCGYLIFDEPTSSCDICPICFWEDDVFQLRFACVKGSANNVSLRIAQLNYIEFGACESNCHRSSDLV
ncbi:CPCC family cysteine-rich protein [Tolypothrix bouteillei VB521301_2]|uniref:CPCC family cysteine-rich protein n=1 Tax=Tolypothrix bouteillei TaxID=1246981 RepID=UPI0009079A88